MRSLGLMLAIAGSGLLFLSALPEPAAELGTARSGQVSGGSSDADGHREAGPDSAQVAQDESGRAAAVRAGKALFQAKGCSTCHTHREVTLGAGSMSGPDLTDTVLEAEYLRAWLSDPAAIRPGTRMPNLGLSAVEIEALIAFLNSPGG